jgi:hypothetical protein
MHKRRRSKGWERLKHHSLSLVSLTLLLGWLIGYQFLDPSTHLGAFFGNAVADWSGSLVIIVGTKFLYEAGSAESKPVHGRKANPLLAFGRRHSLLLFLLATGLAWTLLFLHMSPQTKWGQVVGNIVSEWGQMFGLVFLTKSLIEKGSKESR